MKLALDPRTKLSILLIVSIIILILPDLQSEWVCVAVILLTLILMRAYGQALRSVLIYGGLCTCDGFCYRLSDDARYGSRTRLLRKAEGSADH